MSAEDQPQCSDADSKEELEAIPIADPAAFKPFGAGVSLIIAERQDGTLQAYVPADELACAGPMLLLGGGTRPQKVLDLEKTGWTCCQVNATTWRCSRMLCGMRIVKTIYV